MDGWPFLIPIVAIVSWFTFAIVRARSTARVRELEIRERIAMIEKGLVPSPETDPRGFERMMSRYDRYGPSHSRSSGRHRRVGILLIGVGFGMMLMLGFAADDLSKGVGIGGFLVLMGCAFLVNAMFERREQLSTTPQPGSPAPSPASVDSPVRHD